MVKEKERLDILPLIISIVGYSKSGKTTLLEKMIPVLTGKGYSVGLIKHSGHGFSLDQPEKDSQRLGRPGPPAWSWSEPAKSVFLEKWMKRET